MKWLVSVVIFPLFVGAQVYDPNDTPLRKSFEEPLSKARNTAQRFIDAEKIINNWGDVGAAVVFLVGGPNLYLNPQEVHTNSKDFLEDLHDRYNGDFRVGKKVFLRKLQNNILKGETEDLLCHLFLKAKTKIADFKIMLVGHSYGSAGAIRVARCLDKAKVELDLLITVDTVWRPVDGMQNVWQVPWAVHENFNFHQKHGFFQCPQPNYRPDGSEENVFNFRQFVGRGIFNPHMYVFTNLVRYNILKTLAIRLVEPSAEAQGDFESAIQRYISKYPLE